MSSTKPTRSGYTFLGWGLSTTSTSASYQPGDSYTSNTSVTLYALWSCSHPDTNTVWDTGCAWRKVCKTCYATLSSGTTHGPYTYGGWEYANISQHKRTKDCNYGDYSTVEYESHGITIQYEEYSAVQHMKYSYCAECSSIVGSKSYESHSFVTTYYDGKTVETCSLCGYSKTTLDTYTVTYNANGGTGSPSDQTKVHGVTLKLSSVQPTRFNYAFVGWATSSSASTAEYTAGSNYTDNESVTLYAVWRCTWSKNGQKKIVWRCTTRLEYGKSKCSDSPTMEEEALHRAILKALSSLVENKDEVKDELKVALGNVLIDTGTDICIAHLEAQLKEQENDMMRVVRICAERGNQKEFEGEFKRINANITELHQIIEVEKTKIRPTLDIESRLDRLFEQITAASADMENFENSLIRQLVAQVRVESAEELTIILHNGFRTTAKI